MVNGDQQRSVLTTIYNTQQKYILLKHSKFEIVVLSSFVLLLLFSSSSANYNIICKCGVSITLLCDTQILLQYLLCPSVVWNAMYGTPRQMNHKNASDATIRKPMKKVKLLKRLELSVCLVAPTSINTIPVQHPT